MDLARWRRIEELFESALVLPAQQRSGHLQHECGKDLTLLQEVQQLIDADHHTTPLFNGIHAELPALSEDALQPSEHIGPYRIERLLGAGGMGTVYQALDTRLERTVAIKVLHQRSQGGELGRLRFMAEARAISNLRHPNLCTLFDIGETENGQLYLVMSFEAGASLDRVLAAGALPVAEALHIIRQVAEGLRHAHAHQIFHRDVKPSNIIVDEQGNVVLVDFGVAKMIGHDLTSANVMLGTLAYISPEQLTGGPVDHRTDLWALGVVLYEILTGRRPFAGEQPEAVIHAVLNKRPQPVDELLQHGPPELQSLLDRTLNVDVDKRFPCCDDLLAALVSLRQRRAMELGSMERSASPQPSGEMRQVIVLNVCLAGFRELTARVDAESAQKNLHRCFSKAGEIITEYGGVVHQLVGESLIALFGATIAHADDAERAVAAGRAVSDAISEGQELPGAHLGIAGGRAVVNWQSTVSRDQFSLTSTSVAVAARFSENAVCGEILVTDDIRLAVGNRFRCIPHEPIALQANEAPVIAWRAEAAHEYAGSDVTTIVGRDVEIGQFEMLLADWDHRSIGAVVYVRGGPGIGKTRLCEHYRLRAAQTGMLSCFSRIQDFGEATGANVIARLLGDLLALSDTGEPDQRAASMCAALAELDVGDEHSACLLALLRLPQPVALRSLYDAMDDSARKSGEQSALRTVFSAVVRRRPLLVAVEDIHWADAWVLDCLSVIAAVSVNLPLLVLFTSRFDADPLSSSWRTAMMGISITTIDLAPISNEAAVELAQALSDADSALVTKCVERADGNPLFLEQLLRQDEASTLEQVPPTVQSLALAQLDNLEDTEGEAIRAAAVIGQSFSAEQIRHMVGDNSYDCRELMKSYLVRPDEDRFLFAHALIQEAIYDSLLGTTRCTLHTRAANWYADRDLPLYARHLERAGNPGAAMAYHAAAAAESRSYHHAPALDLIKAGLACAQDQTQQYALHLMGGELQASAGEIPLAIDHYRQALRLAEHDKARCAALIGLAAAYNVVERTQDAMDTLQHAQRIAEMGAAKGQLTRIHYLRGSIYFPTGRNEDCRAEHELALNYARDAESPEDEARALSGLGDAEYARGRMRSAYAYFQRCIELCTKHGYSKIEAANRFMVSTVRIYFNELESALEDSLHSAEIASKVSHRRAEIVSRLTAGWILIDQCRYEEAKRQVEIGLQLTDELGARRFEPFLNESRARLLAIDGKQADALTLLEESLVVCRDTGMTFIGPWLLSTFALLSDDPVRARAALGEGKALLAQGCVGHNYYRFYQNAMEACLKVAEWKDVESYAHALADYTESEPVPWSDFYIARARALCRFATGTRDPVVTEELCQLRDVATNAALRSALPALNEALEIARQRLVQRTPDHIDAAGLAPSSVGHPCP